MASNSWVPPLKGWGANVTYIEYPEINRTDFKDIFTGYQGGVGGQCSHFSPPFSYWCSKDDAYANSGHYTVPSGLRFKGRVVSERPYRWFQSLVRWCRNIVVL